MAKDGTWTPQPARIIFRILPPWWATWWFRSLMVLCALAIILLLLWWRIRVIRKENETQQKLSELRTQALGLQMNPHFIFNCLNAIHHFITANEKESGRQYLSKFGKLVRGILDQSTHKEVPLSSEIDLLELYLSLEKLRMGSRLEFVIDTGETDTFETFVPPMLIQPYVENAVWHGLNHKQEGGYIHVTFRENDGILETVVEDNGVGRSVAAEMGKRKDHKSISTASIGQRLDLLNAGKNLGPSVITEDLFGPDNKPTGTRVRMKIPIIAE